MFCGEHLRGASTNVENPLGHGELHSSTNKRIINNPHQIIYLF
jgi:hypothetical protein